MSKTNEILTSVNKTLAASEKETQKEAMSSDTSQSNLVIDTTKGSQSELYQSSAADSTDK